MTMSYDNDVALLFSTTYGTIKRIHSPMVNARLRNERKSALALCVAVRFLYFSVTEEVEQATCGDAATV